MSMWTQWNKMAFEMKEWCASQPVKAPKCVVRKSDTDYNKFGFLLAQCVQCGKILSLSHFSSSCNLLVIYVGGGACIYLFFDNLTSAPVTKGNPDLKDTIVFWLNALILSLYTASLLLYGIPVIILLRHSKPKHTNMLRCTISCC